MALILCIDTATPVCSVSLGDGEKIVVRIDSTEEKSHAGHLALFVDQALKNAGKSFSQIDAIAVSKGPGSFTGLRIGVSMAKGLCYAGNLPLIAIDTLQAMAAGMSKVSKDIYVDQISPETALYCPMVDARRMEVYTAVYNFQNQQVEKTKAMIIDEHSFIPLLYNRQIVFAGDGANKCKDLIKSPNAFFLPGFSHSAANMIDIAQRLFDSGKFEDIAYFEPYYLKDFIVTVSKKKVI